MNKQTVKMIIGAGILIMVAAGVFVFYATKKPPTMPNDTDSTGIGFFPGGENSSRVYSSGSNKSISNYNGYNTIGVPDKSGTLTQLTRNSVSGGVIIGTSTVFYVEKSTGNIYKINLSDLKNERISNATILKIFDAQWSSRGDKLALRYFDDPGSLSKIKLTVKTALVSFNKPQSSKEPQFGTSTMQVVPVPQSLTDAAVSSFEDKIFYLFAADGSVKGITADFKNKNQKIILDIPFGEFSAAWPAKNIIALSSKPSYMADGYLYFLNPQTGALKRVLGNIKGLTALVSPFADKIIYSESGKNGVGTAVFDTSANSSSPLGMNTFAEKCVWDKKDKNIVYCGVPESLSEANYPDIWYQGIKSLNDSIWRKNLLTGETTLVADRFGADIINPKVSEDGKYLIFVNKKDGALWSLGLK